MQATSTHPPTAPIAVDRRHGGGVRRSFVLGRTSPRERRLAERLDEELAPMGAVLHGCRLDRATARIDHLVVAPSGVWVVIADHSPGRLDVAGTVEGSTVVTIDAIDRSAMVRSASRGADHVASVLAPAGFDWLPVSAALCFTNARRTARTRRVAAPVAILGPAELVDHAAVPGPLLASDALRVADVLRRSFDVDRLGGDDD